MTQHQFTLIGRVHKLLSHTLHDGRVMHSFALSAYAGGSKDAGYKPSYWVDCLLFGENPPQEKAEVVCAGHLSHDSWTDKATGEQRGKHKLIVQQWHPHARNTQGYGQQSNGQDAYVPF